LDSARAFYDSNLELRDKNITWPDFKVIFQKLFRSIGTGQYHHPVANGEAVEGWIFRNSQILAGSLPNG